MNVCYRPLGDVFYRTCTPIETRDAGHIWTWLLSLLRVIIKVSRTVYHVFSSLHHLDMNRKVSITIFIITFYIWIINNFVLFQWPNTCHEHVNKYGTVLTNRIYVLKRLNIGLVSTGCQHNDLTSHLCHVILTLSNQPLSYLINARPG